MIKNLKENVCEESVFSSVFKRYVKQLHSFLYYKFGSQIHVEDKVQEAFVKLWEKCKDVPVEKAKSFLFTVANNISLNEVKHVKVVMDYKKISTKDYTNEDPSFIMEEEEYLQKYKKALEGLSEARRTAFLMNRIDGMKHKEIAELLGISVKAVEKRIYGALKELRKEIEGIR